MNKSFAIFFFSFLLFLYGSASVSASNPLQFTDFTTNADPHFLAGGIDWVFYNSASIKSDCSPKTWEGHLTDNICLSAPRANASNLQAIQSFTAVTSGDLYVAYVVTGGSKQSPVIRVKDSSGVTIGSRNGWNEHHILNLGPVVLGESFTIQLETFWSYGSDNTTAEWDYIHAYIRNSDPTPTPTYVPSPTPQPLIDPGGAFAQLNCNPANAPGEGSNSPETGSGRAGNLLNNFSFEHYEYVGVRPFFDSWVSTHNLSFFAGRALHGNYSAWLFRDPLLGSDPNLAQILDLSQVEQQHSPDTITFGGYYRTEVAGNLYNSFGPNYQGVSNSFSMIADGVWHPFTTEDSLAGWLDHSVFGVGFSDSATNAVELDGMFVYARNSQTGEIACPVAELLDPIDNLPPGVGITSTFPVATSAWAWNPEIFVPVTPEYETVIFENSVISDDCYQLGPFRTSHPTLGNFLGIDWGDDVTHAQLVLCLTEYYFEFSFIWFNFSSSLLGTLASASILFGIFRTQ